MRISSAGLIILVAACGQQGEDKVAAAPADDRIECAMKGEAQFTKACAIERDERSLILRHADGGFRRLELDNAMALSAADGAGVLAGTATADGRLEVDLDGDRYRIPNQ